MADFRRYADDQARRLFDLVQLDLTSPPRGSREMRERRGMHRVSRLYRDPAIAYDVGRSVVPQFSSR